MGRVEMLVVFLRTLLRDRAELAAENLALPQQFAIQEPCSKRPRLRKRDRIFWAWLFRFWSNWRSVLVIVQPQTVVRWHQQGFRLYWRWKSRSGKVGRPKIDAKILKLIRRMCRENPTWGAREFTRSFGWLATTCPQRHRRRGADQSQNKACTSIQFYSVYPSYLFLALARWAAVGTSHR